MNDSPSPDPHPTTTAEPGSSETKAKRVVTPEEQQHSSHLPLTPPLTGQDEKEREKVESPTDRRNIEHALSVLRGRQDLGPASSARFNTLELESLSLKPTIYQLFLNQVNSDPKLRGYVADKARYDYDPVQCLLTIRMPSSIHESTVAFVRDHISQELRNMAKGGSKGALLARKIHSADSSTIFLNKSSPDEEMGPSKDPDAQFIYEGAEFPGLIIEVAYTHGRPLEEAAETYIEGTDGAIRAVLGVDISYKQQSASVSLWCTQDLGPNELGIDPIIEERVFLDESGEEVRNEDIQIRLSAFAPNAPELEDLNPEPSIRIPMSVLAQAVKIAKSLHATRRTKQGSQHFVPKKFINRKRRREEVQEESENEEARGKIPRVSTKTTIDERDYRGRNPTGDRLSYQLRSKKERLPTDNSAP